MGNGQVQPTWALYIPRKLLYYTSKMQNGGYFCVRLYFLVSKCSKQGQKRPSRESILKINKYQNSQLLTKTVSFHKVSK